MINIYQEKNLNILASSYLPLDERMYTLISGGKVIVVDPNVDEEMIDFLKQNSVSDITVIVTHCHYDHISGLNRLQGEFNCTVIGTEKCIVNLESPRRNLSKYANLVFMAHGFSKEEAPEIPPFSCHGDIGFEDEYRFAFNGHEVLLKAFPGHSDDGLMLLLDRRFLFTGDNLIPETATALTLPGSSKKEYEEITKPFLLTRPEDTMVFPAHKDAGMIKDILNNHPDYSKEEI